MNAEDLIETWQINNRINLYLLDAVPDESLGDVLASKGRDVGKQFAHIHNVRLMWLKVSLPDELERLAKIENDQPTDKTLLRTSLAQSGESITRLLQNAIANGDRVKGFKPHVIAYVGYITAHEAHHRSQIIIALKQSGHPVSKKVGFGIWEWGTR